MAPRPHQRRRASAGRGALAPADEAEESGHDEHLGLARSDVTVRPSCASVGGSGSTGTTSHLSVTTTPFRTTKALSLAPHHLRRSPDETMAPLRQQRAASFADDGLVSHPFRRSSSMGSPTPSLLGDLLDGDDGELYDAFRGLSFEDQMGYSFPSRPPQPSGAPAYAPSLAPGSGAYLSSAPSYEPASLPPPPRLRQPIPVLWAPNSLRASALPLTR